LLCITNYNRVNGGNYISITNIHINLTTKTTIEIGYKIISYLNDYLESKDKSHRFRTYINYGNVIRIEWYNASGSSDDFEFMLCNEYTVEHFEFDGGADSPNLYATKLNKDNYNLYIILLNSIDGVYDS
jgi:hypothetical protein